MMTSTEDETALTYCRLCNSACGILVTIRDGRPVRVIGDPQHPLSGGFTCMKGRALPAQHSHPQRLLHSLRRTPDGDLSPVSWSDAANEIADRLAAIVELHGPRAVALYSATAIARHPVSSSVGYAFWSALGSPMVFTPGTIDQPGKPVATALHGRWGGGIVPIDEADVWLVVGANPFVSKWAGSGNTNPKRVVREGRARGMSLLVIDPRQSETAAAADVHLRPRPGQDAALLAGMIRHLLAEGLGDIEFQHRHIAGVAELRRAVEPFTPDAVERRCGVPADDLRAAVAILASTRRGVIGSGTGLSMAGDGSLGEYLVLALQSLFGYWRRAGEKAVNPGMLVGSTTPRAQAVPQPPAWGVGEPSRVRGLSATPQGMPTATLPDEILLEGDGQVRALLCVGGNPAVAWPHQRKTLAALDALDLLVCFDPVLNETAQRADYVIAPRLTLETTAITNVNDQLPGLGASTIGFPVPFAAYGPAVVEPPPGSDVVQEAQFFFAMARRLGLTLRIGGLTYDGGPDPSDDDVLRAVTAGAPVTIDELQTHPRGALFEDRVPLVADAEDIADHPRLNVGHPIMTDWLTALAARRQAPLPVATDGLVLELTVRRTPNCTNSSDRHLTHPRMPRINPAHLHPSDAARLGVRDGDLVDLTTRAGTLVAVVAEADDVRPGSLSIAHGFGDGPDRDHLVRDHGSNVNRLIDDAVDYDPYTGQPAMTGFPVTVRPSAR